jgi:hypothetical protein
MAYHDRDAKRFTFTNKYGTATLVAAGGVRPVRGLLWSHVPDHCKIADRDAYRLVLITENLHLQLMFEVPMRSGGDWAYLIHVSASEVILAKVESIQYVGPEKAYSEIEGLNRRQDALAIL